MVSAPQLPHKTYVQDALSSANAVETRSSATSAEIAVQNCLLPQTPTPLGVAEATVTPRISYSLKPVRLGEVFDNVSPKIDWRIPGICPTKGVVFIAGDSGVGKTWIAGDMAKAMAAGSSFLGEKVKQCNVLMMDAENGVEELARRHAYISKNSAQEEKLLIRQNIFLFDASVFVFNEKNLAWLEVFIEKENVMAIFLDPFRSIAEGDENSSADMQRFLKILKMIAEKHNVVFIALHHFKKKNYRKSQRGGDDMRGSGHIRGTCDAVVFIEPDGAPVEEGKVTKIPVTLTINKIRKGKGRKPVSATILIDDCLEYASIVHHGEAIDRSVTTKAVLCEKAVMKLMDGFTIKDTNTICSELSKQGHRKRTVEFALARLLEKGFLKQPVFGEYQLKELRTDNITQS